MKNFYKKWTLGLTVACLILIIALGWAYYANPIITGLISAAKQFSYSDKLDLGLDESSDYMWIPENKGLLKALKVSGTLENKGNAKIYLESKDANNENKMYLIFDSSRLDEKDMLNKITGFAAQNGENRNKEPNRPPVWDSDVESFVLDEILTINLDEYFNDKDNDTLTYSASELKGSDLGISLDNGMLTIKNKNNAEENKTLSITASDYETSKKKNIVIVLIKKGVNEAINETPIINITNQTLPPSIINKSIKISLEYEVGTNYDVDDNGIETTTGIIDFTVKNTKFNWGVNEKNICTRWDTYSTENDESTIVCYGSQRCCNFIGLEPTREAWDETFYSYYGLYDATLNNIISAQVLYVDYNLSLEQPYTDIAFSEWEKLNAVYYYSLLKFDDVCMETCSLAGFNDTSYSLVFEINGTTLNINSINYIMERDVYNEHPILIKNIPNITIIKNWNYSINLNEYFFDPDNDILTYSYYKPENISVIIEGGVAALTPDNDFVGENYMFFTASDTYENITSNVFKIDVKNISMNAQTVDCAAGCFIIQDAYGNELAKFDSFGNANIKGNLVENAALINDANDLINFIIKNPEGNTTFVVTNPEGNTLIKGILNENEAFLNPSPNSLIIQNNTEGAVAYVDSIGNLHLKGTLTENVLFT